MKQSTKFQSISSGATRRFVSFLSRCFFCAMIAVAALTLPAIPPAHATVTVTGTNSTTVGDATDPATWGTTATVYIGTGGTGGTGGTLTVGGGSALSTSEARLGQGGTYTGTAIVDGAGSSWTTGTLYSGGQKGTGILNIINGATVAVGGITYIGFYNGGGGTVTVDGIGSSLTTGTIYLGGSQQQNMTLNIFNGSTVNAGQITFGGYPLGTINFGSNGGTLTVPSLPTSLSFSRYTGTGTIKTGGFIGDLGDLLIDAVHTPTWKTVQTWNGTAYDGTTQNIAIQVDPMAGGDLAIGYHNAGSLTIKDGRTLSSSTGYIGHSSGSTGTVNVSGTGSKWNLAGLYVGNSGTGSLGITGGASVASGGAAIGNSTGSNGTVIIDGTGSNWTVSGDLSIGPAGTGSLNILNGASVNVTGTTGIGTLGHVNLGSTGATLTTGGLIASASQLSGTGAINTSGIVSDLNLIFDASHGLTKNFSFGNVGVSLTQSASGVLGAGNLGTGSLTISDGVNVASSAGFLGYNSGSTGTATVNGAGSKWTNGGSLYVGNSGTGTLKITGGGLVTGAAGYIGNSSGSTGAAAVTGAGSTWTNSGNLYIGNSGTGTMNITSGGLVTSAVGYIGNNAGSTGNAAVNGATWTIAGDFYVGNSGTGALSVTNGGTITSGAGSNKSQIGYAAGSKGSVTVDGSGSTWTAKGPIYVGNSGAGTLNVTNSGNVSGTTGFLGYAAGSSGTATVDGTSSAWTNSKTLYVGYSGTGNASISDGGAVTANAVSISSGSTLTVDVGKGSLFKVGSTGTGTITNNGTIRLVAGAGAANGTYTPMAYGGTLSKAPQVLGGVWDGANHTVNVSGAATAEGIGGATAAFNLATHQRALITDTATGHAVGAGFRAGSADATFTATSIGPTALAALQGLLASGNTVLSAWDFSTTGTTVDSTNPVYLSLSAGPGQSLSTLAVWHYDGTTWSAFTANDLAYDGTYASFTVTDFSGYAVSGTAPVPVPAAVWMLGPALAGIGFMRKRIFKA